MVQRVVRSNKDGEPRKEIIGVGGGAGTSGGIRWSLDAQVEISTLLLSLFCLSRAIGTTALRLHLIIISAAEHSLNLRSLHHRPPQSFLTIFKDTLYSTIAVHSRVAGLITPHRPSTSPLTV